MLEYRKFFYITDKYAPQLQKDIHLAVPRHCRLRAAAGEISHYQHSGQQRFHKL